MEINGGSIAIGVLAYLAGIVSPLLQKLIAHLVLRPRLRLVFNSSCQIEVCHRPDWTDRYVRVKVTNEGWSSAHKCRVWLTQVDTVGDVHAFQTDYSDFIPLIWSFDPKAEYVDLPPGVPRHADIAKFSEKYPTMVPQLRGADGEAMMPVQYRHLFEGRRVLRLTIEATSDETSTTKIVIQVDFDGNTLHHVNQHPHH